MRPLKTLEIVFDHCLLESLGDEQGVPLLWSTISSILFCVGSRYVDFFFSSGEGIHLQGCRANVLWAVQKNFEVLVGEVWVEIHDFGEIDQTNFESCFRSIGYEDVVDHLEEERGVFCDSLRAQLYSPCDSAGGLWPEEARVGSETVVPPSTSNDASGTAFIVHEFRLRVLRLLWLALWHLSISILCILSIWLPVICLVSCRELTR